MYVVDDWEVEREDCDIGAELGKGSFGMVYKGIFKDPKKVIPRPLSLLSMLSKAKSSMTIDEYLSLILTWW